MRSILINRFNDLSSLFILSVASVFLLALRIKLTHDFYMLFLVWNLFLALLPYFISLGWHVVVINSKHLKLIRWLAVPVFSIWLLILPNAPYMITDLVHIRNASGTWLVYDSILIACFAVTGCWAGFKSMQQMVYSLTILKYLKTDFIKTSFEYVVLFLCALGIYLGRDLRWNSWDILQHPDQLFTDTFLLFINPLSHQSAWLQIVPMSIFLMVCFSLFNSTYNTSNETL